MPAKVCYVVQLVNNTLSAERELEVLENIYHKPSVVHQRDLARIVGLSLGMINAIIKRLIYKGWLKASKINERKIQYIVSPQGIEAIARRSYRYFKRTIKNVVDYKEAIAGLVSRIAHQGYSAIVLAGKSDLDFIVEHQCFKHRLGFYRQVPAEGRDGCFVLLGEKTDRNRTGGELQGEAGPSASLRDILMSR